MSSAPAMLRALASHSAQLQQHRSLPLTAAVAGRAEPLQFGVAGALSALSRVYGRRAATKAARAPRPPRPHIMYYMIVLVLV